MKETIKLLLVEDDFTLSYILQNGLQEIIGGYKVVTAANGWEGLKAYKEERPDIIVADVEMPVMDGREMVTRIREADCDIPILLATALTSPSAVTEGYKLGVDNYIKKPFVVEELDAHIRALLKLKKGQPLRDEADCYSFGLFTLDAKRALLKNDKTGEKEVLSVREAGILRILAQNKNQVVRRSVIISHNWDTKDDEDYCISRSLDVYLVKLRKKLVGDPNVSIKTVKGVGFMLVEE